jgi:hypothetical protein
MTLELSDDGYGAIMDQVQMLEDHAWEGILQPNASGAGKPAPDAHSYKMFQEIVSESRKLRRVIQENLLIVPNAAGPNGPEAA